MDAGAQRIGDHSTGSAPERQSRVTRPARTPTVRWGQRCERTVDGSGNPGDWWKLPGITLGIRKYLLTWCLWSATVSTRTGERTPTGVGHRVRRARPSGRPSRGTDPIHEVEAAPDGARSHVLRGTGSPGDRRSRTAEQGRRREGTPTVLGAEIRRRQRDGTGDRVSVNGVEGRRSRATGNRVPTPVTEVGSPTEGAGGTAAG